MRTLSVRLSLRVARLLSPQAGKPSVSTHTWVNQFKVEASSRINMVKYGD